MTSEPRMRLFQLVGGIVAALCSSSIVIPLCANAQDLYPSKPITILVGSAPGGSNDIFARTLSKRLQDELGQPVIVENKPAAGGILANNLVARAVPDGYTLVLLSSTFTTGAAIRKDLQYDAIKSFKPVAMIAKGPLLVTVNVNTPYKSLIELIDFAKLNPKKVNYGTSGIGSINQFATEAFSQAAGIQLTHVPYKGMGPAVTDLLGGQIDMIVASAPSLLSQVNTGKILALGVTSKERARAMPQLPTLQESGLSGGVVDLWWGVLAPANTPDAIVERLNETINKIMLEQGMQNFLNKEGAQTAIMTSDAFAAYIKNEIKRWQVVAHQANIQPE